MSRYTGPRLKIMRALGVHLPGLSRKSVPDAPNHPPGQHGARPKRKSQFGVQLLEKQKLRFNYGLSERQMQRVVREARSSREQTGKKILELLERRLDNAVFRAGFAPTVLAARQMVSHCHIRLNGQRVNIASIRVKPGDQISLTERARNNLLVQSCLKEPELTRPEWLTVDETKSSAQVTRVPDADEVPFPIDMQQVIEYYAVRL